MRVWIFPVALAASLVIVPELHGQNLPGGSVGWYNGDCKSGIPGEANWYSGPQKPDHVDRRGSAVDAAAAVAGGRPDRGTDSDGQFLWRAPGLIAGVLQVNVTIPGGVPAGEALVIVSVGSVSTPAGVTIWVR